MIGEHEDPTLLTVTQAAKAAGVDRRTIRRRLDGGDFPHARREQGGRGPESGPWLIPVDDLVGAGLTLLDPDGTDLHDPGTDGTARLASIRAEVVALRTALADAVRRAEVAEARAAERERVVAAQELALRALAAGHDTTGRDTTGHEVPGGDSDGGDHSVEPESERGPVAPDSGDLVLPELRSTYRPGGKEEPDSRSDASEPEPDGAGDGVPGEVPPPVTPYPESEPRRAPTFSPGAPSKPTPPWVPIPQPPPRRRRWPRRP